MTATATSAHDHLPGILTRCSAVAAFTVMTAAFKWAGDHGAGMLEMLFFRGLIGAPVVLAWLALSEGVGAVRTRRPAAHLFRAVIGIGSLSMIYAALIRLPMAEAVTIGFSAPAFSTILSVLLLKEKVGRHRWAAVLLGFVGVIIVTRPGGEALPTAGLVLALLGAVGNGAATVTIRQMGARENPAATAFWFLIFGLLVGGIGMLWVARPHEPMTWLALAAGGLAGAVAQMGVTRSLHLAPVSVVVPFDYLQLVGTALLGWLIWSTLPGTHTLVGALLITASGLYTAWREHRLHKANTAPMPVE